MTDRHNKDTDKHIPWIIEQGVNDCALNDVERGKMQSRTTVLAVSDIGVRTGRQQHTTGLGLIRLRGDCIQ